MTFITREVGGKYMNLEVVLDNNKIDLGLHNKEEIKNLIYDLEEAIEDFKKYLE